MLVLQVYRVRLRPSGLGTGRNGSLAEPRTQSSCTRFSTSPASQVSAAKHELWAIRLE
jgi:hypothetical protein